MKVLIIISGTFFDVLFNSFLYHIVILSFDNIVEVRKKGCHAALHGTQNFFDYIDTFLCLISKKCIKIGTMSYSLFHLNIQLCPGFSEEN